MWRVLKCYVPWTSLSEVRVELDRLTLITLSQLLSLNYNLHQGRLLHYLGTLVQGTSGLSQVLALLVGRKCEHTKINFHTVQHGEREASLDGVQFKPEWYDLHYL